VHPECAGGQINVFLPGQGPIILELCALASARQDAPCQGNYLTETGIGVKAAPWNPEKRFPGPCSRATRSCPSASRGRSGPEPAPPYNCSVSAPERIASGRAPANLLRPGAPSTDNSTEFHVSWSGFAGTAAVEAGARSPRRR